jgi:hypothetical protein
MYSLRQAVTTINMLSYKNGTAVRAKMRDARLLDMRNTLAQHCLLRPDVQLRDRLVALGKIENALVRVLPH